MKITRDDIKEMVNETLSIIIEGRRPYDNLTDFFNNNIEKIKLGQLEYNDLPSNFRATRTLSDCMEEHKVVAGILEEFTAIENIVTADFTT